MTYKLTNRSNEMNLMRHWPNSKPLRNSMMIYENDVDDAKDIIDDYDDDDDDDDEDDDDD